MQEKDVQRLQEKIDNIGRSISDLSTLGPILRPILRNPKFTTLREAEFVEASIDSLTHQVADALTHYQGLIEGAGRIVGAPGGAGILDPVSVPGDPAALAQTLGTSFATPD